jgi:hypothetical protein
MSKDHEVVEIPGKGSVFIGMPLYSQEYGPPLMGSAAYFSGSTLADMHYGSATGSLLTFNCNRLLAMAYNLAIEGKVHFFAMLHADVVPPMGWVDTLIEEMLKHNADLVSVVIPLRNASGETSTAKETPGDGWTPTRFNMERVSKLATTFRADGLLVNTGCCLFRLHNRLKQWLKPYPVCFEQRDRIAVDDKEETYYAQCVSEDWGFSRMVHARGGRIWATTAVKLYHGKPQYSNEWKAEQQNVPPTKEEE